MGRKGKGKGRDRGNGRDGRGHGMGRGGKGRERRKGREREERDCSPKRQFRAPPLHTKFPVTRFLLRHETGRKNCTSSNIRDE